MPQISRQTKGINQRITAEVLYKVIQPRRKEYGVKSISDVIARMDQEIRELKDNVPHEDAEDFFTTRNRRR